MTSSSSTLIDHILSDTSEKICQFGTISLGLSDHFFICDPSREKGLVGCHIAKFSFMV